MLRTLDMPLISNGYRLSMSPERLGYLEPTDPARPRDELWEQYQQQGYLWLKGILNRKAVLEFRRRYFQAFEELGLLAPGSNPVDGIYAPDAKPSDPALYGKVLMEVVRWAAYESFCLSPEIWMFYEMFLEGAPYLHKRKIIRHTKPGDPRCTGAHYDLIYLRGGTDRVCTSWIPLGDIPIEMGGLVYLEGSDAWGRQQEAAFGALNADLPPEQRVSAYNQNMKSGWLNTDLPALADQINARWLMADYEAGDMVVHSAYMVHAATQNNDPHGRMRLSTDIRYQRIRDEIDARWQNHWFLGDML